MDARTFEIEQEFMNGEHAVYPGHPVTLGIYIMSAFPDIEAALERDERSGYCAALSSMTVPGAGGSVRSALTLLEDISRGALTPEDAVNRASGFNENTVEAQKQAERLTPKYLELVSAWIQAPAAAPVI